MSKQALPARARKSEMVYLRVTPLEMSKIVAASKKAGKFTTSEWLREIVRNALDNCPTQP